MNEFMALNIMELRANSIVLGGGSGASWQAFRSLDFVVRMVSTRRGSFENQRP